jgi:hypothetical protein
VLPTKESVNELSEVRESRRAEQDA